MAVRTVAFERLMQAVKHAATLLLTYELRQAALDGFDDVLFVDAAGRISEGSVWNVCFLRDGEVVLPAAPMLEGITVQVVIAGLGETGVRFRVDDVLVEQLASCSGAVFMSSRDPAQRIDRIDDVSFAESDVLAGMLQRAYDSQAPQRI